jgi:hypothetical protein
MPVETPSASAQPTPQGSRDWQPPPEYPGALVDDLLPNYQEMVRELESDFRLGSWELAQASPARPLTSGGSDVLPWGAETERPATVLDLLLGSGLWNRKSPPPQLQAREGFPALGR